MKKAMVTMIVVLMMVASFFCGMWVFSKHIYSRDGIIVEINETENTFVIDDGYFLWESSETDGFEIGDRVTMVMYDNFSINIKDDKIIERRYTYK